jgi:hypothetical protein
MDTAQAVAPAETSLQMALEDAAKAFTALDNPASVQKRDETGKFAAEEPEPEDGEDFEDEQPLDTEEVDEDATEDSEEAEADEADDEPAQPLPPSWPEDMAETWKTLPAETQQYLLQRDAEQTRALNSKFQEIANARKAAEAEARAEANAKREELLRETERLQYAFQALAGVEPDPRAFGGNTQAFQQAYNQWRENAGIVAQLEQQREAALKEHTEAKAKEFEAWKQQVEGQWAPKLLEAVPELTDPARGAPAIQAMVDYAKANGIPEDVFSPENQTAITSPELLMIWKAMQYDKARSGKAKAKPKPGPVVKPGVSSPRSAQKQASIQKRQDRLAREGSVEAGAAVFKDFINF